MKLIRSDDILYLNNNLKFDVNFEEFVNNFLRLIKEKTSIEACNIFILDEMREAIKSFYVDPHISNLHTPEFFNTYFYLSEDYWITNVIKNKKEIYFKDIKRKKVWNQFPVKTQKILNVVNFRGCYIAPIFFNNKPLGSILFFNVDKKLSLSRNDKKRIHYLNTLLGRAIDNLKTYNRLETERKELKELNRILVTQLKQEKGLKKKPKHKKMIISEDFFVTYSITEREKDIIYMLIKGMSNKKIGFKLFVTENTIKKHIYNIYKKTNVKNRIEFINLIQSL